MEKAQIEWEQYIGEIVRNTGVELKTFKKITLDRDLYRKWINGPMSKERGRRRRKCDFSFIYWQAHEYTHTCTFIYNVTLCVDVLMQLFSIFYCEVTELTI